ncbi:hypothetical protein ABZ890_45595 [Streptomyces sp. NPDC046984]|uniref:hypothetical protein n=1 Tax=Streptomyces sp. NPDC046984 TaxID=3155138 RepID=UPI0033EE49F6
MSADEPPEQAAEEPGKPGPGAQRAARITLFVVGTLAVWGIVAALPEIAYVIVGILGCLGWQRIHAWWVHRHEDDEPAGAAPDVAAALWAVAGTGRSVLLTELRDELGVGDAKVVRALLGEAGVPVRSGVRTVAGNGPGVHRDDLPAPPPPRLASPESGVGAGQEPTPTPTTEALGLAGVVVKDGSETSRRYRIR